MGSWGVIARTHDDSGDFNIVEIVGEMNGTKEQALGTLDAVVHSYLPLKRRTEIWRRVYRLADGESYVVVIKVGMLTQWHCTLQVAELVSDSKPDRRARSRT